MCFKRSATATAATSRWTNDDGVYRAIAITLVLVYYFNLFCSVALSLFRAFNAYCFMYLVCLVTALHLQLIKSTIYTFSTKMNRIQSNNKSLSNGTASRLCDSFDLFCVTFLLQLLLLLLASVVQQIRLRNGHFFWFRFIGFVVRFKFFFVFEPVRILWFSIQSKQKGKESLRWLQLFRAFFCVRVCIHCYSY